MAADFPPDFSVFVTQSRWFIGRLLMDRTWWRSRSRILGTVMKWRARQRCHDIQQYVEPWRHAELRNNQHTEAPDIHLNLRKQGPKWFCKGDIARMGVFGTPFGGGNVVGGHRWYHSYRLSIVTIAISNHLVAICRQMSPTLHHNVTRAPAIANGSRVCRCKG